MVKRTTLIMAILAVLILAFSVVGSTAYTSLTMDRSTTVDVVGDDSGIVQLTPGSSSFVQTNGDQLSIDVTNGGASGVNAEANLLIGSPSSPTSTYAYTVINNDNQERTMTFNYNLNNTAGVNGEAVKFTHYDASGNEVASFSNTNQASMTFTSGEEHYVVVEVDTVGLSSNEDLSGVVSIVSE